MKLVILLGAPGSGKGTVAGRIAEQNTAFRHLSSGDLLRDAVKRQTPAGQEADGYMKRGELVPDKVIADMIKDYIADVEGECTLLLDGFPRTVVQAEILDQVICDSKAELLSVVLMEVADEILFDRIAGRRTCPKCGAGYHVKTIRPVKDGICDVCGTELAIRKDDNPETVRNRLTVYRGQTVPLIDFYSARGVLRRVDAVGAINDIVERVKQALT
jgi:adenylate kinase